MEYKGDIRKMISAVGVPINYKLPIGDNLLDMNALIGLDVEISYQKIIHCIACGVKTIKSFGQGFCYQCFKSAPQAAPCILRPELCEAHLGIARDMKWSEDNCLQAHYVYLSFSSNLKVGVTRASQIPTRWIDQGAVKAIKLCKTPNRHTAGVIELELKKYFADKTSWQKMLKGDYNENAVNLYDEKEKALKLLPLSLRQYTDNDNNIYKFVYPSDIKYPKIKSINLDKDLKFKGKLAGIKGQYLIFEGGNVINMRKYTGYELSFRF